MRKIIGLLVAAVAIVLSVAACSSAPTGFHNMANLEASVQQTANKTLSEEGNPDTVTSVTCTADSTPNQYQCILYGSEGDTLGITVTVSANGQSWVED